MEPPRLFSSAVGSLLVASLLIIIIYLRLLSSSKPNLPPGPRPWPLIGNLPFLMANSSTPHRTLARLSLQYGPIFTLWMGSVPTLVVSSPAMAKEFLQNHDKNFSDRPKLRVSEALHYGQQNGLGHRRKWRELRRLLNLELLTQKRLQEYEHMRHEEVAGMIELIERQSKEGEGNVDVRKCVSIVATNIIARLAFSTRLVDWTTGVCHELQHVIVEANRITFALLIGDYIPFLGWLDVVTLNRMRGVHRRVDELLSNFVGQRLREETNQPAQDFLDVLLANPDAREELDSVKSLLLELFQAGIDSSSVTVEWAMAELLRHPKKLKKLQEEIDVVVGGEKRLVRELEASQLPYLKAVIKETLRLHPPAPLLVPHASHEECIVMGGYKIPPGTRLLVNAWAIANDPDVWDNPHEFIPERFFNNPLDVLEHDYELLPFGSGRRMCPGLPLALLLVSLTLANLVHNFHWFHTTPYIDILDKINGPLEIVTPLRIIPKPRLTSIVPM